MWSSAIAGPQLLLVVGSIMHAGAASATATSTKKHRRRGGQQHGSSAASGGGGTGGAGRQNRSGRGRSGRAPGVGAFMFGSDTAGLGNLRCVLVESLYGMQASVGTPAIAAVALRAALRAAALVATQSIIHPLRRRRHHRRLQHTAESMGTCAAGNKRRQISKQH